MKARYWLLSAFILLLINLGWIWRLGQDRSDYSRRISEDRNRYIQANKELYLMNRVWKYSMRTNDQQLPENIEARTLSGVPANLYDRVGQSRKLILVLSDRHCSSCVDHLLFTVKNEIPELCRKHVVVLFSRQEDSRQQWIHRNKVLTGAQFIEIPDKSLQLPMDSLDTPYFFLTGPEHQAYLAFTPYPSLEAQTLEYLNLIKQRFFN